MSILLQQKIFGLKQKNKSGGGVSAFVVNLTMLLLQL
jgi:hypothetical protein